MGLGKSLLLCRDCGFCTGRLILFEHGSRNLTRVVNISETKVSQGRNPNIVQVQGVIPRFHDGGCALRFDNSHSFCLTLRLTKIAFHSCSSAFANISVRGITIFTISDPRLSIQWKNSGKDQEAVAQQLDPGFIGLEDSEGYSVTQ